MFRDIIRDTPLTTEEASGFFSRINGDSYSTDITFLSTLRALVYPRLPEDESLNLYFTSSSYTAERIAERGIRSSIRLAVDFDYVDCNGIYIHSFTHPNPEDNKAWMVLMKSSLTKEFPEWHCLEKVTDFFKKSFDVLCFIAPETKSVVLFVENMNIRQMHYLQCSIFALLPWYFDPKNGVSQLEMELIESLRKKDSSAYIECISKIAEQYDFRTENIRRLLNGFELRHERQECESVKENIRYYNEKINTYDRNISDCLRSIRDLEIRLFGLEAKISEGSDDSEIMDYFLRNNRLILESVTDDGSITFTVKSYLEYFDEDMAKSVIEKDTSYIYAPDGRNCAHRISGDNMRKLMTAVFIDQTIRIRVCATYRFNLNGAVSGLSGHPYGFECREYTPNPHIDGYSCLGNYTRNINEFLRNHDYIGAIEQCAASCKSLNFGDSIVMAEFMKRIYGISDGQNRINIKCFELPDGTVVTPIEAINWINSQEVQSDE